MPQSTLSSGEPTFLEDCLTSCLPLTLSRMFYTDGTFRDTVLQTMEFDIDNVAC